MRVVLEQGSAGAWKGPLPVDSGGATPLDVAIRAGHRKCAEYLLAWELKKPPQHRTAVIKVSAATCMPAES